MAVWGGDLVCWDQGWVRGGEGRCQRMGGGGRGGEERVDECEREKYIWALGT